MKRDVEESVSNYDDDLSQSEADWLLKIEKIRISDDPYQFPNAGKKLEIPVTSINEQEMFLVSVVPGKVDISVTRNQIRTKGRNIILARLDTSEKPHTNPDGEILRCPHIHIYREGFNIRYAYPLDIFKNTTDLFKDISDPISVFQDFMKYCNITKQPILSRS